MSSLSSIFCCSFFTCISLLCTYSHNKLTCFELSATLFLPPSFLSSDLLFHSLPQLRPALTFLCSALVRFLEFFSVSPCHQFEVSRWFTQTHKREKWLLISLFSSRPHWLLCPPILCYSVIALSFSNMCALKCTHTLSDQAISWEPFFPWAMKFYQSQQEQNNINQHKSYIHYKSYILHMKFVRMRVRAYTRVTGEIWTLYCVAIE